jgi:hypothetical protein
MTGFEAGLRRFRPALRVLGLAVVCCTLPASGKPVRIVAEWPTLALLLEKGPQYVQSRRDVKVYGVVRGNSTVLVSYRLEQAGALELEIKAEDGTSVKRRFPPDGLMEAETTGSELVQLPRDFGDAPTVGVFSFRATGRHGRRVRFHLEELGVAESRREVSRTMPQNLQAAFVRRDSSSPSLPLSQSSIQGLAFQPAEIRVGDSSANYSFKLLQYFNKLEVRVFRETEDDDSAAGPVWEKEPPCAPNKGVECKGPWDGLDRQGKASLGLHTLVVFAWMSSAESKGEPWSLGTTSGLRVRAKG